ncbi:hypothetical protein JMJ94_00855 [Rhodovulum visakhapatnamense]|nr:hypothetical protein [Rhodovulum visakhapatnamense]
MDTLVAQIVGQLAISIDLGAVGRGLLYQLGLTDIFPRRWLNGFLSHA